MTCVSALLRVGGDFCGPTCTDTLCPALDDHSAEEALHRHGVRDHEPHGHPGALAAARAVDPVPVVTLEEDHALVEIHTWTKWGGLHRAVWRVSRSFPHQMTGESDEVLAPYDCGFVF